MATPVLICDDSSFARKQIARALPRDWDIAIGYAADGAEALAAIQAGKGDILFLDLNMPGLDGYEVLSRIRAQDLPTLVIVVSGDVQPQARERVLKLGALEFVRKPVDAAEVTEVLRRYGIHHAATREARRADIEVDVHDGVREVANVAMGQAAELLARLLKAFVHMPIPKVRMIARGELGAVLNGLLGDEVASTVCQGFIGAGVAGEALLAFRESSFSDLAGLLGHEGEIDEAAKGELLTDIATILIGACLKGIADQLDIGFSQSHPVLLARHVQAEASSAGQGAHWRSTLAIEMHCAIDGRHIGGDLLLLFTEDSVPVLSERIAYVAS